MRPVDYALAVAMACLAASITLVLLAPSVVGETHEEDGFDSVSEPVFTPPKDEPVREPVPTIVESESAQPLTETVENAVWGAPELAWDEEEPEPEYEPETEPSEPQEEPEMPGATSSQAASAESEPTVEPTEYREAGVTVQGDTRFTWYSSHESGGEVDAECEADSDGIFRDADGYIVVASWDMDMGEVVVTPLGEGKVYDRCPTSGVVDVYTDWS